MATNSSVFFILPVTKTIERAIIPGQPGTVNNSYITKIYD